MASSQGESDAHGVLLSIGNRLERDAEEFVKIDHEHKADTGLGDISVKGPLVGVLPENLKLPAAVLGEFVHDFEIARKIVERVRLASPSLEVHISAHLDGHTFVEKLFRES